MRPLRLVLDRESAVELLQQFALPLGELSRGLNPDFDEQIALAWPFSTGTPLFANAKRRPDCVPSGIFSVCSPSSVGTLISAAKRHLRKRDRNHAVQVVAFALEERMFFDVQHDIKIARRAHQRPRPRRAR